MSKITHDEFEETEMFSVPSVAVSSNPLAQYFRLPGLSVSLPTNGAFFPEGGIVVDEAGEVAVLPMRSADELLLSSPDALMNNSAIIKLLQSCVPAIKRPDLISVPDLEVLLVAIRVASTGETMDMDLECPKCHNVTTFEIDLPAILNTMQKIPAENPVRISADLVAYLKPHTVAVQTKIVLEAFKETRAAQAIDADPTLSDDDKAQSISDTMNRLAEIHQYGIANSVLKITTPHAEVTNREHIQEFLKNTDKRSQDKITKALEKLNSLGINKSIQATCSHCKNEWIGAIEFNPATFFEDRSSD